MKEPHNLMVTGMGGQGVVTCGHVLAAAAAAAGWRVGGSEKRGGAQRGGAAEVVVRCLPAQGLAPHAYGAGVPAGELDVLIGLEPIEALRRAPFASKRTLVVLDTTPVDPVLRRHGDLALPTLFEIRAGLEATGARVVALDLVETAKARWGKPALANLLALGWLAANDGLPFEEILVRDAIRAVLGDRATNDPVFTAGGALLPS
jgi:indolepyruvate ferredoxin oxidoreductase beta subunit